MEPSKAALRAAKAVLGNYRITAKADGAQLCSRGLAEIIETETHTAEMAALLVELTRAFYIMGTCADIARNARTVLEELNQEPQ